MFNLLCHWAPAPSLWGESDPGSVVAGSTALTVWIPVPKRWLKTPLFLHIGLSYNWPPGHSFKRHIKWMGTRKLQKPVVQGKKGQTLLALQKQKSEFLQVRANIFTMNSVLVPTRKCSHGLSLRTANLLFFWRAACVLAVPLTYSAGGRGEVKEECSSGPDPPPEAGGCFNPCSGTPRGPDPPRWANGMEPAPHICGFPCPLLISCTSCCSFLLKYSISLK